MAGMSLRLRQVALAARDLHAALEGLREALDLEVAFRDPGVAVFGLRNAVLPVGDTFLEVVSPVRPGTTAGRWLERRGGDAGYMVILQCEDLDAARRGAEAAGVRVVWETTLPRRGSEPEAATIHLHPRDVGGAILSLDRMDPPDAWRWAGPAWREHARSSRVRGLAGAELEARDPQALARRWAEVLGLPATPAAGGCFEIALDAGLLRFVPERGRGEGLAAVLLASADPARAGERHEVCGTRLELV